MTSWAIIDKATGEAVMETFSAKLAESVNAVKYEAVPIAKYLGDLNRKIKTQQAQMKGPV